MKILKKITINILILCLILSMVSCSGEKETTETLSKYQIYIYCLNSEGTEIQSYIYTLKSRGTEERVAEVIKAFTSMPKSIDQQAAWPEGLSPVETRLELDYLNVYFNALYSDMSTSREVLSRAAFVRTMVQLDGVDCVSFYVEDGPLKDLSGNYVGIMTADTFVENVGQQINAVDTQELTLYFASIDGKSLVPVTKTVYIMNNVTAEKTIIEQLMQGYEDLRNPIPNQAVLLSVSTNEGICLVNFDGGFLEQDYTVSEEVVIYSIVNSLCELTTVNKVQISVNGETDLAYRENYSLQDLYERNLDLIETEEE